MSTKAPGARYGGWSIGLHWLMFLLIAAAYATMELKSVSPRGSAQREALIVWHYMIGMSVFFLAWVRLIVRFAGTAPAILPAIPAWQVLLAKAMHWVLYALMIGLPLLGWLTLSAKGAPVPFFGIELPALMGKNELFRKWFRAIHEVGATTGYFLIGLHTLAALYHHYVRRDNVMRLMLPVVLVWVFVIVIAPPASAFDPERAALYFANELAECGAWYTLVAEAPGVETTAKVRFRAVGISLVSSAADIKSESFALARANAATKAIWREMDGSWRNYSVVDANYGERCRALASDPVARRTYWLDKRD